MKPSSNPCVQTYSLIGPPLAKPAITGNWYDALHPGPRAGHTSARTHEGASVRAYKHTHARAPADITTIEYGAEREIVATNARQFWSPARGAVDGLRVSLFGLTGDLAADGSSIAWSNSVTWVRAPGEPAAAAATTTMWFERGRGSKTAWRDNLDPKDVTAIEYDGASAIVATNARQSWSPTTGSVDGLRLSMLGLTADLEPDGTSIFWSNGRSWTKVGEARDMCMGVDACVAMCVDMSVGLCIGSVV